MNELYQTLYTIVLVCLALALLPALFRAIRGPRIADRIMAINLIGTAAILIIAVLGTALGETSLFDVCLIYCLISFLAVVVLAKTFITVHYEKLRKRGENDDA